MHLLGWSSLPAICVLDSQKYLFHESLFLPRVSIVVVQCFFINQQKDSISFFLVGSQSKTVNDKIQARYRLPYRVGSE